VTVIGQLRREGLSRLADGFPVLSRSWRVGNGSLPPAAFHSATSPASCVLIVNNRSADSVLSRSCWIWSCMAPFDAPHFDPQRRDFAADLIKSIVHGILEQKENIQSKNRCMQGEGK
jgi:hypothetical protein